MTPFEIMNAPLTGVNLVEASAGTGKTWNIEALTVRLMLDKRRLPADILVVTFTEAATQELRERIYKRLIEVIRVLRQPDEAGEDPFLKACAETYGKEGAAAEHLRHLERCKQRFDESSISTIHGFCKNVLSEFSHLTRTDIDVTIETEGSGALVDDAVDDFWRGYNAREATAFGGMLAPLLYGPLKRETLQKRMKLVLRQHEVHVLMPDPPEGLSGENVMEVLQRLQQVREEIIALWSRDHAVIRQQVADTKIRQAGLDKHFDAIEAELFAFLDQPLDYSAPGAKVQPSRVGARFLSTGQLNKGHTYRSEHPVHALVDEALELAAYIADSEQRRALHTIRQLYRDRCARDGVTTFDDLLRNVALSLREDAPENGGSGELHAGLRKRYPAALIDEFQDTDPVQFEIFRRIFIDHADDSRLLYLIGDPKQAIYMFRGADLRTYLNARKMVKNQYSLEVNFRSSANMVDGVNALFEGPYSFINPELTFQPARANQEQNPFFSKVDLEDAGYAGNERALHFPKIGSAPYQSKAKATMAAVGWTARHIARSLESARRGEATGFLQEDGAVKPLSAGDIAVLVSSNSQARLVKDRLAELGVPAVVGGETSIFETDDARLVNLMLDVLVDPQRLASIRTLLASRLCGMSASRIAELMQDDLRWSEVLGHFAQARLEALSRGVLAGLRYMNDKLGIDSRLISWSDGERRITNMRHLGELLDLEQRRGHRNLAGLTQWLRSRRNDPGLQSSDSTQMRLESDENRVVIMTMHSSKGLQFPVVYTPFLWESRSKSTGEALYFDETRQQFTFDIQNEYAKQLRSIRGEEGDTQEGFQRQDAENIQDRVRLLYVAVTRSKYRCYVPHAMVLTSRTTSATSPFAAMLLRDPSADLVQWHDLSRYDRAVDADKEDLFTDLLNQLDTTRFCVYEAPAVADVRYQPDSTPDELVHRVFPQAYLHRMAQHVRVESYSSLKPVSDTNGDTPELPDRNDGSIFAFPRGAHTGNFWHYLFETIDFTDSATFLPVIRQGLQDYGFESGWEQEVLRMVTQVVQADMDGFRLCDITPNRGLREMEFFLPYDDKALMRFIEEVAGIPGAATDAGPATIQHYLTGFIDLLIEHEGRYYIVDYKSDYLGDKAEDYGIESINLHMRKNKYNVQYHLYAVALYLYLSNRLEDVRFEDVFGGVRYVFLRGIDATGTYGLYADRPDPARIQRVATQIQSKEILS